MYRYAQERFRAKIQAERAAERVGGDCCTYSPKPTSNFQPTRVVVLQTHLSFYRLHKIWLLCVTNVRVAWRVIL
jgi:hypothetical protein